MAEDPNPLGEVAIKYAVEFVKQIDESSLPEDITHISCIKCVEAVPVFSADEIDVGDHIIFNRAHYDHHGIVVEKTGYDKFKIAEATNTAEGLLSYFFGSTKSIAKLLINENSFNFRLDKICIVKYKVRAFSKSEVAERAKCFSRGDPGYDYKLVYQNCEHFATLCVTGKAYSMQVAKIKSVLRLLWTSGPSGIDDEMRKNEYLLHERIICESCYKMNKKLIKVEELPIKRRTDVNEGDIIRYVYWGLWHTAVVLEMKEMNHDHIICKVAHYAFRYLSPKTIKEEEIRIQFNGNYKMIMYKSADFEIYPTSTVVERAKSRIGEQRFAFFANDSSHFARWCKIKGFCEANIDNDQEEA